MRIQAGQLALRVSLVYCALAGAWIFFSDRLLAESFTDPAKIAVLQTVKGWAFVLVTGALLFLALRHQLRRWERESAQRRQAEEQRREPERRLATLISNLPGLSYRCRNDKDFTTEFVSDGVAELTGYPASDFLEHRRHFGQLIHPDDREAVGREIGAAIREKRSFELTYRIQAASGAERWVWERGSAVFDSDGAVGALEGFVTDVTERKQAEEAVRKSEKRLRDLIDGLGPSMFVGLLTPDGTLIEGNQPALAATGLKPEDAFGRLFDEIPPWTHTPEVKRQLREAIDRAARGEASRYDVQVRGAGNQLIDADFSLQPVRDESGKVVLLVPSGVVITERKRAEDQLRERERRLSTLISSLPGAAFRVRNDPNYTVEYVSDQIEELTGYPADDFRQHRRNFGDLMHPDDREWVWNETQKALEEHRPYEITYRFIDAHQRERWNWERGTGIYDAHGELQAIEGFAQDITERKLAEQRIQHLNRLYHVLSDINQLIVREKDPQTMMAAACQVAVETGKFRMAWIGMLDAATHKVKPVASAGVVDGYLSMVDIDLLDNTRNTGPTARVLRFGTHAVCGDIANDPPFAPWRNEALQRGYRSSAAFPLKVQGNLVGTFNLYWHESGFFDEDELRLLDELAMDISFALEVGGREIERRAAEDRHTRQRNTLIALTSQRGPNRDDVKAALGQLAEAGARTLSVARVSVWRYNQDHSAIECADLFDQEAGRHSSGAKLSAATHPAYFCALSEAEVIAADDAMDDPRTSEFAEDYLRPLGIRAMLDVPINIGGVRAGVLCHEHVGSSPRLWTADEKTFALAMANLVSLTLEGWERRQAQAALHQSEERFRQLAENIQEVFWMTDAAKDRMLYISPAYEKIWGRTCASLYESPRSWLEAIHADDRERVLRAAETKQASGDYDETYRILRPDASIRWIHDRAFPVRAANGEVLRIVGTAEDISERRQLEEQFRQSQKLEAIGQLAGGVAHDFNNILAAIMMQADLAATDTDLPTETRDMLDDIKAATERAANLTRQLLAFSRRQVMQPRELDLNEIVTSLTKMLQRILGEDVRLQLNLHPRPLLTRADAGMLDQVLLNLVVNSRDAMPGGGRLFIETAEKDFTQAEAATIPDAKTGRHVCLRVTDTGSGIAPENMSRIFEPFFTTKDPGKGTGLGLATVFGIVKQHGGSLTVKSEVGKGTTFEIFLPATEAAVKSPDEIALKPKPLGGTETVLLVEDEPAVRMLTRVVLERAGYSVLEAAHGLDALKTWEQHQGKIQLLFTDIVMPEGMSGRELAGRLQERRPGLRVIYTSGYSADVAGRELSLQAGQNFIQKPSSPQQVLETVRRCLDG